MTDTSIGLARPVLRQPGRFGSALRLNLCRLAFLLAVAAVWQEAAWRGWITPIFIGDPIGIVGFFWHGMFVDFSLVKELTWTLAGTVLAFGLGSAAGIAVGLGFIACPTCERFVEPIFAALNAVPRIALAPLFLLWFGLGLGSKVALGFSLTFFIVLSSTLAGGRGVNTDFLTLARTLGARPSQVFLKITLPSAVPVIFSGLRLGLVYSLLGVVGSEIIASQHGLGQSLTYLAGTFQTNGVFAVLLLMAILGGGITRLMSSIEARLLRWR